MIRKIIRIIFCCDKPGYYCKKSQVDKQSFVCLDINEKLQKAWILSGLTIYNYEDMVIIWRLNGNCFTKEFQCNFLNALWPTLANGLLGVGLVLWGSSLSCVGGENDVSSTITEKALLDHLADAMGRSS